MKILIVSGFLGAGKTTFIKRLARNVDQRFAILENEYGAAGIDGARLGQNRQGTQKNVWEMTEQCICCIGKKDFAASVLTIAKCGRPREYLDRRTDRRRKSRPDYRKSDVRSSTREFSFSRRSLLWMFTVTAAIWRNIPSCIQDQIPKRGYDHCFQNRSMPGGRKQRIQKFLQEINSQAKIITDYASTMTREDYQSLLLGSRYEKKVQDTQSGEKDAGDLLLRKYPNGGTGNPVVFSGTDHSRSVWKYHPCKRTVRSRRPVSPI